MEKYIDRCLKSILSQTHTNIEIIVVDDGSTDDTATCLARYTHDQRVRVVRQTNGGEAAARNTGMRYATGSYIGFVDADDYIAPTMYETMYKALKANEGDLAVCNFNLFYKGDKQMQPAYAKMSHEVVQIQDDVYGYFAKFCACPRPNNYVWTRLYRREIITESKVLFRPYSHSTDTLFTFKLLPHIKKTVFINEGLYYYNQRGDSGIHTIATKGNIAALYADTFEELANYYEANGFEAFMTVLPLHAYTRLRSVFFYSRLAGHTDLEIMKNLHEGFKDRMIYNYLTDKR